MASEDAHVLTPSEPPPPYSRTCTSSTSILPEYSCSILLETTALLKPELAAPWRASLQRSWRRVHSQLQGTRLIVASSRRSTSLGMQGAAVGLATDYHRRSNVIRIRAEGWQFLLALPSMAACIEWVDRMNESITISIPLEDRIEPGYPKPVKPQNKCESVARRDELWRQWRERRRWRSHSQTWLQASTQDHPRIGSCVGNKVEQHCEDPFEGAASCRISYTGRTTSFTNASVNHETTAADADSVGLIDAECMERSKGFDCVESEGASPAPSPRSLPRLLYSAIWNKDWDQSPRTEELVKSWRPPQDFSNCVCSQCAHSVW